MSAEAVSLAETMALALAQQEAGITGSSSSSSSSKEAWHSLLLGDNPRCHNLSEASELILQTNEVMWRAVLAGFLQEAQLGWHFSRGLGRSLHLCVFNLSLCYYMSLGQK